MWGDRDLNLRLSREAPDQATKEAPLRLGGDFHDGPATLQVVGQALFNHKGLLQVDQSTEL